MRITIFGATGLLGKALIREWREDDVTGFGSADGDIRDEKRVLSHRRSLIAPTKPSYHRQARVAKLVKAAALKAAAPHGACGFESRPGHSPSTTLPLLRKLRGFVSALSGNKTFKERNLALVTVSM